jgi:hypothetical protein
MNGPFEVELKIHFTVGDNEGSAAYSLPPGVYPTKKTIREAMDTAITAVKAQFGDDAKLMSFEDFNNTLVREKLGVNERFAIPGDWEK